MILLCSFSVQKRALRGKVRCSCGCTSRKSSVYLLAGSPFPPPFQKDHTRVNSRAISQPPHFRKIDLRTISQPPRFRKIVRE